MAEKADKPRCEAQFVGHRKVYADGDRCTKNARYKCAMQGITLLTCRYHRQMVTNLALRKGCTLIVTELYPRKVKDHAGGIPAA